MVVPGPVQSAQAVPGRIAADERIIADVTGRRRAQRRRREGGAKTFIMDKPSSKTGLYPDLRVPPGR
jgi:hypothetical protein